MDAVHDRITWPLRHVLIGYLLIIFDISFTQTTDGVGLRLDLLNDTLGAALVLSGCVRLARLRVSQRYDLVMEFVRVSAAVQVLASLRGFVAGEPPGWLASLIALVDAFGGLAFVGLCLALLWLAQRLVMPEAERRWRWASGAAAIGWVAAQMAILLPQAGSLPLWLIFMVALAAQILAGVMFLYASRVTEPTLIDTAMLAAVLTEPGALLPERSASYRRARLLLVAALLLWAAIGSGAAGFALSAARYFSSLPPAAPQTGALDAGIPTNRIDISPDGTRLLASSWGTIRVFSFPQGVPLFRIDVPDGRSTLARFSADGRRIVELEVPFSRRDSELMFWRERNPRADDAPTVWDAATGAALPDETPAPADSRPRGTSPDGTYALRSPGYSDPAVEVWDVASGRLRLSLPADFKKDVGSVAFSPDSRLIATSSDAVVKLWDAQSGAQVLQFAATTELDRQFWQRLHGHLNWVSCLAFSPDGRRIAVGSMDASAGVWDVATGRQVLRLVGHEHDVVYIAFSRDGQTIITSDPDGDVRLWDAAP